MTALENDGLSAALLDTIAWDVFLVGPYWGEYRVWESRLAIEDESPVAAARCIVVGPPR